ncbi:MAG: hypothetical protein ACQETE_03670 [Bacteroidota bacterium]
MTQRFIHITLITLGVLATLLAGCKPPQGGTQVQTEVAEPAFMYANDEGQVRLVEIDVVGNDTTYIIDKYVDLGQTAQNGTIETSKSWHYDMSPLDSTQNPRISAFLKRDNPAWLPHQGPTGQYFNQMAYISDLKRINTLEYYSQLNDRIKPQEYKSTAYFSPASASHYVNRNTLITLWFDFNEDFTAPNTIRNSLLLMRHSLNSSNPLVAETITTFKSSLKNGLPSPYVLSEYTHARLNSSANGEFYIVWSPTRTYGAIQPFYYIRKDGTAALNSMNEIGKDYRTSPGYLIHALSPHPKKDSIVVVADISDAYSNGAENNALHVMHLPDSPQNWLRPIHTLPWNRVINSNMLNWTLTHGKDNLFLSYSPEGDKIAIAHAIPTDQAEVVIWEPESGNTKTFSFPDNNIDKVSKPAWHPHGNRFMYITAANTASDTTAYIYMLDTDKQNGTLKRLDWNSPQVDQSAFQEEEILQDVKPLIGRRFNQ